MRSTQSENENKMESVKPTEGGDIRGDLRVG